MYYLYEFNDKDYLNIKKEMFNKMSYYNPDFNSELELFDNIDFNYNESSYNKGIHILKELIKNYQKKSLKHKFELIKFKYKPFLLGIPNSDKYEKYDPQAYLNLLDFEKSFYSFLNYAIKESILKKEFYKISIKNLKNFDNKKDKLSNIYITLKSIELLQIELDKKIKDYTTYIEAFGSGFNVTIYNKVDSNKLDLLHFYFENINNLEKKKVKHLHY